MVRDYRLAQKRGAVAAAGQPPFVGPMASLVRATFS